MYFISYYFILFYINVLISNISDIGMVFMSLLMLTLKIALVNPVLMYHNCMIHE